MSKGHVFGMIFSIVIVIGFIIVLISPTISRNVQFEIQGQVVDDFGYILQYDSYTSRQDVVSVLKASKYDLLIMEGFYQYQPWTRTEIGEIAEGNDMESRKILLCYMSIGEAESYRSYWNSSWDGDHDGIPDDGAPEWLDIENPSWPGNYKVHFWDTGWQRIIFGTNESYLDYILTQGFDGVYLDMVDAYEYYEAQGINDAAFKMLNFVAAISQYAKAQASGFLIVPQNGEGLAVQFPEYLTYVDGIGREDIFTLDDDPTDSGWRNVTLHDLHLFLEAGKFVFDIEYPTVTDLIDECYSLAEESGFLCYVGPRDLNGLQVIHGHEPT